jgi:hypothetical protein
MRKFCVREKKKSIARSEPPEQEKIFLECRLYVCIVTWRLKARTVEWIDAAIARQLRGKHVSAAADTDTTIQDAVFAMWSVPRLHNEDQLDKQETHDSQSHEIVI